MKRIVAVLAGLLLIGAVAPARADAVGTSFPPGFNVPIDVNLGVPVLGFGGSGPVDRVPVIFLHGNNDTAYPTTCNGGFGKIHNMASYFHDNGYATSELWGLSYQGDQCDLLTDPPQRSGANHATRQNVPDLRAFVAAVLDYTGATQVDIVGHSLGTTLAREWMRQDNAYGVVRRLVGVDGPNHGIINCSPNVANFWQLRPLGGFTPDSEICEDYGTDHTDLLATLNAGDETPGPTEYMTIVNGDVSFVFYGKQDGLVPPVPDEDAKGNPHRFDDSALLDGAINVKVYDQGVYDDALRAAHLGIINSPETWQIAHAFLKNR